MLDATDCELVGAEVYDKVVFAILSNSTHLYWCTCGCGPLFAIVSCNYTGVLSRRPHQMFAHLPLLVPVERLGDGADVGFFDCVAALDSFWQEENLVLDVGGGDVYPASPSSWMMATSSCASVNFVATVLTRSCGGAENRGVEGSC